METIVMLKQVVLMKKKKVILVIEEINQGIGIVKNILIGQGVAVVVENVLGGLVVIVVTKNDLVDHAVEVKEMVIAEGRVLNQDMKQRITTNTVGLEVKKNIHHHIIIS
jgi:hypothetical protein